MVKRDRAKDLELVWDALVIGTGIGGATVGYALAKQGKAVLFCEQGRSSLAAEQSNRGDYAEMFFAKPAVPDDRHRAILERSGRWAEFVVDHSAKRLTRHIPFIGAGTGGSSALYGAAMERFFPEDFTPASCYPDRGEASLPDAWPLQYQEFAPYYAQAEHLFGVKGGRDPLRADLRHDALPAAPPFGPANQALADLLSRPRACILTDCRPRASSCPAVRLAKASSVHATARTTASGSV